METPEPGIYPDVPFEQYAAWDAMNASTLVEGLQSMRRLRAKLDGKLPDADSDAKRFGRAVHCRLLEPDRYPTAFPQVAKCVATTKPAKKGDEPKPCKNYGSVIRTDGEWLCGVHAQGDEYRPKDFITPEESERVEEIRKNAFDHREIRQIRRFFGSEVSIVFDLCGVRCKARLDKLIEAGGGFIIDVKTTSKPLTESGWSKQIADLNYHFKAAFYLEAVKALKGVEPEFWWVVVEVSPPFDVAAIRMSDFDRSAGRWDVMQVLTQYRQCLESGLWPGAFPELVQHVGLPPWKAKEYSCVELGQ